MPNLELLAMLSAHGIDPLKPMGGIPSITQMDVAAMLSGCSKPEEALLRAKYCGDTYHDALSHWVKRIKAQTSDLDDEQVELLSKITLSEHLSENLCQTCGGIGEVLNDGKIIICTPCGGMGRKNWSARQMSKRLGVSKMNAKTLDRVEWCRQELRNWERQAVANMKG